jgi:hypothetical protein
MLKNNKYDIILRRVYETIVAVQKQNLCVCACVGVRVCVGVGARARACACKRVALLIQHATCSHIVICDLSGSTMFFDIISQTA